MSGNTYIKCLFILVFALGTTPIFAQVGKVETGVASFYHDKFVGRKTANGEIYSQDKLTAAHKNLPLGTWVKVTNLSNDSVVIVRINDRMPQWNKRTIDLTEKAAGQLNFISKGLTKVKVEVIAPPDLTTEAELEPRDLPENIINPIKPKLLVVSTETNVDIAGLTPKRHSLFLEKPKKKRRN